MTLKPTREGTLRGEKGFRLEGVLRSRAFLRPLTKIQMPYVLIKLSDFMKNLR